MLHTTISIIAAIGQNRELGGKNQLLWNIPGELKRFKEITTGHPIIMGRKTFESIGRVLPNRTNIIITRDRNYKIEGAIVVQSLDEAIKSAERVIASEEKQSQPAVIPAKAGIQKKELIPDQVWDDKNEVFIIGGGQIFTLVLPITNRLYLTLVHKSFPKADVFFPEYKKMFTKELLRQNMQGPEFSYTFLTLEK